jgi:putative oxidoreductase
MNINLHKIDNIAFLIGRSLLGLYFLIPGISKIIAYSATLASMELKGVFLSELALPLTIAIQIGFSISLLMNKYLRISSLILCGLTLLINLYMHDFWNLNGDPSQAHELQNFIKNLGIIAGLLILSTKEKHVS